MRCLIRPAVRRFRSACLMSPLLIAAAALGLSGCSGEATSAPPARTVPVALADAAPQSATPRQTTAAAKRPTAATPAQVALLRTPNGGIQPQAAVGTDGTLHLIYYQGAPQAGDVYYVRRKPGETSFSAPIRVNGQPGSAIAIGTIRGAQIALGKGDRVHVAWNGSSEAQPRGEGKGANPMLYTRLNDEGTAFEPQRNVVHTAYGLDGGGSVAADPQGNVYVVWHGNPDRNGEANRRIFVARSTDNGRTFGPETAPYAEPTGACGCCGTKAFTDHRGTLYVLYRTATGGGGQRDMYLLTSRDHGQTFDGRKLAAWSIATCPMSSETFAAGPQGVVGGWETAGQVSFTRIDPQTGQPDPAKAAPAQGTNRKHPALAVNRRGETLLVWTEGTGWKRGGSVAWQVYDANGRPTAAKGRQNGVPTWSLATAFVTPDGGFGIVY